MDLPAPLPDSFTGPSHFASGTDGNFGPEHENGLAAGQHAPFLGARMGYTMAEPGGAPVYAVGLAAPALRASARGASAPGAPVWGRDPQPLQSSRAAAPLEFVALGRDRATSVLRGGALGDTRKDVRPPAHSDDDSDMYSAAARPPRDTEIIELSDSASDSDGGGGGLSDDDI